MDYICFLFTIPHTLLWLNLWGTVFNLLQVWSPIEESEEDWKSRRVAVRSCPSRSPKEGHYRVRLYRPKRMLCGGRSGCLHLFLCLLCQGTQSCWDQDSFQQLDPAASIQTHMPWCSPVAARPWRDDGLLRNPSSWRYWWEETMRPLCLCYSPFTYISTSLI